jgi:hypothetical protein
MFILVCGYGYVGDLKLSCKNDFSTIIDDGLDEDADCVEPSQIELD